MRFLSYVAKYICYLCTAAKNLFFPGCVGAELLLGQPLFPGDSGVDQLVEIIKVSAYQCAA